MENEKIVYAVFLIVGAVMPVIGVIIGCIRYNKYKDIIKNQVQKDYKAALSRGGIASLYYKSEGRRIFTKTFGIPIVISFLIGLVLLCVGFSQI